MIEQQIIIFTDMDGTLLDHHTYSFDAAIPTLVRLKESHIPVVPTTSKTFIELLELRKKIALNGPFIVENGAAVYIPHGFFNRKPSGTVWQDGFWCKSFTSTKQYWLKLLEKIKPDFADEFTHFSEMSVDEICEATGLKEAEASRAAQRQFGEPVLWTGSEERKQIFIKSVKDRGAYPLEGGRFIHISGDCNKGFALQWLVEEWIRQHEIPVTSIALGDGKNDIAMLEAADVAVRIASPAHAPPEIEKQENVYTSTRCGPEGWTEVLTQLLFK
ncbi:mannosyl-3-phosphoglycerate phosphatase [Aestuariibacter sp. A3R04]|uniref:HAD-IIB family hydrolase n=1 Tax=Aestuariibacter sp. A3R04 TaxID=2841571 RepID=UPI001C09EEAB|nr:HAD-IIB family hydrolase [Aestuariibacter sp. A3R04]MBU3022782.1 HAD-IIB family hydrolase [Aestuariibacter sp. A3R04]